MMKPVYFIVIFPANVFHLKITPTIINGKEPANVHQIQYKMERCLRCHTKAATTHPGTKRKRVGIWMPQSNPVNIATSTINSPTNTNTSIKHINTINTMILKNNNYNNNIY